MLLECQGNARAFQIISKKSSHEQPLLAIVIGSVTCGPSISQRAALSWHSFRRHSFRQPGTNILWVLPISTECYPYLKFYTDRTEVPFMTLCKIFTNYNTLCMKFNCFNHCLDSYLLRPPGLNHKSVNISPPPHTQAGKRIMLDGFPTHITHATSLLRSKSS